MSRRSYRDGYVYFAGPATSLVAIKIGWSSNPWVAVHEGGNRWTWCGLSLLGVIQCPYGPLSGTHRASLEQLLHEVFAADRIVREWFRPTEALLLLIDLANHGATPEEALAWAREGVAA